MNLCQNYTFQNKSINTHHRVCWTPSPVQPGSSDLLIPHGHKALVERSSRDAHIAGPLTVLLFTRGQFRLNHYLFKSLLRIEYIFTIYLFRE